MTTPNLVAATTRANEILGWHPEKTLEDMVRDAWEWFQAHPRTTKGIQAALVAATVGLCAWAVADQWGKAGPLLADANLGYVAAAFLTIAAYYRVFTGKDRNISETTMSVRNDHVWLGGPGGVQLLRAIYAASLTPCGEFCNSI